MLDPISVALKFGFLIVLYLFLLWVARSALKDLRRERGYETAMGPSDATGLHAASTGLAGAPREGGLPVLRVESGAGLPVGAAYDVGAGAVLGRSDAAEIRLEDSFASSRHARLTRQGSVVVLEDLGSTNGTYLNGEPLQGPQPLHPGDLIRIGDTEFSYEA